MTTELLEIEPRELKFTFELKKQSSCSVRLVNNSYRHVAFKVKTTCPKKYCVRPNIGVVKPKSTFNFTVTMQAPRSVPPDMICKDKFLIQSTTVPTETTDDDITTSMFAKDGGKYVEENKLRVLLVPPPSPVESPIGGTLKQVPSYEGSILKDQLLSRVDILSPHDTVVKNMSFLKKVDGDELKPVRDVDLKTRDDAGELKLLKDIEVMKSKQSELESKLSLAEVAISKLTEERRLTMQERDFLKQELAAVRVKSGVRRVQVGFPFLFVCMVALVSVVLGYLTHP